jgi:hypothetical protein
MSYTTRKTEDGTAIPLGGDPLSDLIKCSKTAIGTVIGGATDPYFAEVLCRISQLQALSKDRTPVQALFGKKPTVAIPQCVSVPPGQKGMGIEVAIKPMRAVVYVHQHPITVWLGLTALLGTPILIGYMIGRRSKR